MYANNYFYDFKHSLFLIKRNLHLWRWSEFLPANYLFLDWLWKWASF